VVRLATLRQRVLGRPARARAGGKLPAECLLCRGRRWEWCDAVRARSVWCFSLPLVLVEAMGWRMVPVVAGACWALLSIEEVGNIIEDPFNMPLLLGPPFVSALLSRPRSTRLVSRSRVSLPVLCAGLSGMEL
jgi:hypothetical protein